MTLYELNQAAYANIPDMTDEQIELACNNVIQPYLEACKPDYYFLLLNNSEKYHYYTFFVLTENCSYPTIIKQLIECVKNIGYLKSIEKNPNGAIEFWIMDPKTYNTNAYYFFDYQEGVIEI